MERKRIQMESSAGIPQSEGSISLHSTPNTNTAYCEESWQCTLTIDDCAACSIWQYAVYGHLKTLNQSITLSELHFIHKTQYSCDRKAFLFFYKLRHSSDRSVLLDKLQQTKGRRKRAKRMMDWANVRMIKDGCVYIENENKQKTFRQQQQICRHLPNHFTPLM